MFVQLQPASGNGAYKREQPDGFAGRYINHLGKLLLRMNGNAQLFHNFTDNSFTVRFAAVNLPARKLPLPGFSRLTATTGSQQLPA